MTDAAGSIVVVTGGAGYIGSHMVRQLLDRGYQVRVVDALLFGSAGLLPIFGHPRLEFFNAHISSNGVVDRALQGASAVIHMAALVGDAACSRDTALTIETNVDGTRRMLDAAQKAGVARFLFASTCSVYGASGNNGLLTETSPLNPVSLYAETKIEGERLVFAASGNGMVCTVLRLATLYGFSPRMRFDLALNYFAARLAQGARVVIYGRNHWRPMLHAADAASAFVAALEADPQTVAGEVFNVGGDEENYRMGQFVEILPQVIPGAQVICRESSKDLRSYHVGFGKIRQRLAYRLTRSVHDGLREVHRLVAEGWLRDPEAPQFRN